MEDEPICPPFILMFSDAGPSSAIALLEALGV